MSGTAVMTNKATSIRLISMTDTVPASLPMPASRPATRSRGLTMYARLSPTVTGMRMELTACRAWKAPGMTCRSTM